MKNIFSNNFFRLFLAVFILFFSSIVAKAQLGRDDYSIYGDVVSYRGIPIEAADPITFVVLGYGYAKDYYNVYIDGQILRYVDPASFRLKVPPYHSNGNIEFYPEIDGRQTCPDIYGRQNYGYVKTSNAVLFNGRKIEGASVSSFEILQGGYARDAFNVYFFGRKTDASGFSFKYLGDGYAEDAFNVYYNGRKIEGTMGTSFKVLGGGYAEDAFNTYYKGKKI